MLIGSIPSGLYQQVIRQTLSIVARYTKLAVMPETLQ
jgi:hypothetical protein